MRLGPGDIFGHAKVAMSNCIDVKSAVKVMDVPLEVIL